MYYKEHGQHNFLHTRFAGTYKSEAELADDKMILSQLENQVEFYRESIKTLDNMGFAVRNRLAIKDLV